MAEVFCQHGLVQQINGGAWAQSNQWIYTFNNASQLASINQSNDDFAWTAHSLFEKDYSVNGLNQYTQAGQGTLCYDGNGNLTADGAFVYLYDVENRLVEKRTQVAGSTCAALSYAGDLQGKLRYDPAGRLYEAWGINQGTRRFLNDGDALVAEYDAAGTLLRRYAHGADAKADDPRFVFEGATTTWASQLRLIENHQGSIVAMAQSTGTNVAINRYDEYGIPQTGFQGTFGYTGQAWLPEVGMWYYKARVYSPTLGRFLQTDPIGYDDQINLYSYVANDPLNRLDFNGEEGEDQYKFSMGGLSLSLSKDGISASASGGGGNVTVSISTSGVSASASGGGANVSVSARTSGVSASATGGGSGIGVNANKSGMTASVAAAGKSLAAELGTNRVSAMTSSGRISIDLAGKGHFDKATGKLIETPHVKFQQINTAPDGKTNLSPGTTRAGTMQDIRTARKIEERRGN